MWVVSPLYVETYFCAFPAKDKVCSRQVLQVIMELGEGGWLRSQWEGQEESFDSAEIVLHEKE